MFIWVLLHHKGTNVLGDELRSHVVKTDRTTKTVVSIKKCKCSKSLCKKMEDGQGHTERRWATFSIESIRSKTVEQSQKGYTDTGSLCPISCCDTKYFIGENTIKDKSYKK